MHDYNEDTRSLADCLKEWQVAINGGKYRARQAGRAALCLAERTYASLIDGESGQSPYEGAIRRLMTLTLKIKDHAP